MDSVSRSSALVNRTMLNCPAFRPNIISIRCKMITSSVYLPTVITIINAWVPGANSVMHFTISSYISAFDCVMLKRSGVSTTAVDLPLTSPTPFLQTSVTGRMPILLLNSFRHRIVLMQEPGLFSISFDDTINTLSATVQDQFLWMEIPHDLLEDQ